MVEPDHSVIGLALPAGPLSVLALGAHPDDIEIGCGGSLLALARRGDVTGTWLILTGTQERRAEAIHAAENFLPGARVHFAGLADGRVPATWEAAKDALEALAAGGLSPDVIFAPRTDDAHQDHRLLGTLVTTVWRDALVLHYEIPKWDGDLRPATHYIPIPDHLAATKVRTLERCFPSQVDRDWWDDEMFLGLMRLRGMECRSRYAEGFWVTKAHIDVGGEGLQ